MTIPNTGLVLEEVLAEGESSIVYAAVTRDGSRRVVKAHVSAAARVPPSVSHPNLVKVHGVFEIAHVDGRRTQAVVMDHVEGPSLRDVLAAHERGLPMGAILRISRDVASALQCLHAHGEPHGALSPSKILLDEATSQVRVLFSTRKPGSGSRACTPYTAPECSRENLSDARPADVYALAVIGQEMLHGLLPPGEAGQAMLEMAQAEFRSRSQ